MSLTPVTHDLFHSLHHCKPDEHAQHFSIAAWAYDSTPPAYRLFCGCGHLLDFVPSTSFVRPWIAVHEDGAIVYSHAEVAAMKAEMDTMKDAVSRLDLDRPVPVVVPTKPKEGWLEVFFWLSAAFVTGMIFGIRIVSR